MNTSFYTQLEDRLDNGGSTALFDALRESSAEAVGKLLLNIPDVHSKLKAALPSMPADEVQISWTGSAGEHLLAQTVDFANSISRNFKTITGQDLKDKQILDYGCGWGRIMRLMYAFTAPENLFGCDPWDQSISLCQQHGIKGNLALCDYIPQDIPFAENKFDLIYSFSVFTHLSERTATAVLSCLRKSIAPDGLLVVTIRPPEYWDLHNQYHGKIDLEKLKSDHLSKGYAFVPHKREAIDGEITYGDASISPEYIVRNWKEWTLAGIEKNDSDSYQSIAYLKPRHA